MNYDPIELIVDEPIEGHFYWMLLKQDAVGVAPRTVDAAPGPLPSYSAAMMAGIAALQRRSEARGGDRPPVIPAFVNFQGGPAHGVTRH